MVSQSYAVFFFAPLRLCEKKSPPFQGISFFLIFKQPNFNPMKNLVSLIAFFFFLQAALFSQNCLPEGITFTTQAQIDNFQNEYPGCTVIEGDVEIYGDDISNLDELSILTSIGGKLLIGSSSQNNSNNPVLTNISGLSNLVTVGDDVEIIRNSVLNGTSGLFGLSSISGSLIIGLNSVLSDLSGLSSLTSIENYLNISHNDSLYILFGLNNLITVGDGLTFSNNYSLKNMNGLNSLSSAGFSIRINENPSLTNINGLENIDPVSILFLKIFDNQSLSNCAIQNFCSLLTMSQANIDIHDNAPGCNSIIEFAERCTHCLPNGIVFSNQTEVDNFRVNYPDCQKIDGNVIFEGEDITQLDTLAIISYIGGSIIIRNNPLLTSIEGLQNLSEISDSLVIINNESLSTCKSFAICAFMVSPTAYFEIENNATGCNSQIEIEASCLGSTCFPDGVLFTTQEEIDNFENDFYFCQNILGDVTIEGEDITTLHGLSVINSINGDLKIANNPLLFSINGLSNLTFLGGDLIIESNNNLTGLAGIDNIEPGSLKNLEITNNNLLTYCNTDVICSSLLHPNGNITITNNTGGCVDYETVATKCGICLFSFINFYEQDQIDSFQADYPGCIAIGGSVYIRGNDITDLNGLTVITSILGDLDFGEYFTETPLTNFSGLENLTYIGRNLDIVELDEITSFTGLENLTSIGEIFDVSECDSLIDFTGLESLSTIGNGIRIETNSSLVSLNGLENLTSVNYFSIYKNASFISFNGIQNVNVNYGLGVHNNVNLTNFEGLENISSLKYLSIRSNDILNDISALENINSVGPVTVGGNPLLPNISIFEYITIIGGDLIIGNNKLLTDLSAFSHITTVKGDLYIITSDSPISNLSGLNQLSSVEGELRVANCDSLVNFDGLDNLSSIYNNLIIEYNQNLTDISALSNLTITTEGDGDLYVYIKGNNSLISLNGLESIVFYSNSELIIDNNILLSDCAVQSICDYLSSPSGSFFIGNNALGCNNPEEVETACLVGVNEIDESSFSLYPNPATNELFISSENNIPISQLTIYNQLGQNVLHQNEVNNSIDISNLQPGVYVIELVSGNLKHRKKLVIE